MRPEVTDYFPGREGEGGSVGDFGEAVEVGGEGAEAVVAEIVDPLKPFGIFIVGKHVFDAVHIEVGVDPCVAGT